MLNKLAFLFFIVSLVFKAYGMNPQGFGEEDARCSSSFGDASTAALTTWETDDIQTREEELMRLNTAIGQDDIQAKYIMGTLFLTGQHGVSPQKDKGILFLQDAVIEGHVDAKYFLGYYLMSEQGNNRENIKRGLLLITEAIKEGNKNAEVSLAKILCAYENEEDANTQYDLACWLLEGEYGVQKNLEMGLKLLKSAASKNHVEAQSTLGKLFITEEYGVSKNLKEGLQLLGTAANSGETYAKHFRDTFLENIRINGDAQTQYDIGLWLLSGTDGMPKDLEKGLGLWRAALNQGHTETESLFGYLLVTGYGGIPVDRDEGVKLMEKAAGKGAVDSLRTLGEWMTYGHYGFTDIDYEKGLGYLQRAGIANDNIHHKYRNGKMATSLNMLYQKTSEQKDTQKNIDEVISYIEFLQQDPAGQIFHKMGRVAPGISEFDNMRRSLDGPVVVESILDQETGNVIEQGDYGNIIENEDYMILDDGSTVKILDLFCRVWSLIQAHPNPMEQGIMKHSFVKGIAEMIDEVSEPGIRVCNDGKAQRLVSVLQGYYPWIQIDTAGASTSTAQETLSPKEISTIVNSALTQVCPLLEKKINEGVRGEELNEFLEENAQKLSESHKTLPTDNLLKMRQEFLKGARTAMDFYLDLNS